MSETKPAAYQARVDLWLTACFGETIAGDKTERNHRFLEEALELVQSGGCTESEAHQLVDYVFARPVGNLRQEVGGAKMTLAAFCSAHGIDMDEAGEIELARVWTKVDAIRAKQAAKPKHSPLPMHVEAARAQAGVVHVDYINDLASMGLARDDAEAERDAARAEVVRLRADLAWYGEQARLARLIHSEGDAGRHALQADGGKRAVAALKGGEA